jgi:hypothetical protein
LANKRCHRSNACRFIAYTARGQSADHHLKIEDAALHAVETLQLEAAAMLAVVGEWNAGLSGALHGLKMRRAPSCVERSTCGNRGCGDACFASCGNGN